MGDHDRAGKLRSLHFVDRRRIGQLDVAERIAAALDLYWPAIEIDGKTAVRRGINHDAHRAIHDAQFVVVLRLDHLVARIWPRAVASLDGRAPRRRTTSAAGGAATRYSTPPCRAGLCASA